MVVSTPMIPAFKRWSQEDQGFEDKLGYIAKPKAEDVV